MKRSKIMLILVASFLMTQSLYAADLEVVVRGFEDNQGAAIISLHNNKDTFPSEISKAFRMTTAKINNKTVSVTFTDVPAGTYALAVVHDQNSNGELDTNFLGIPQEGVVVSGSGSKSFGAPAYEDSVFSFEGDTVIPLVMRH